MRVGLGWVLSGRCVGEGRAVLVPACLPACPPACLCEAAGTQLCVVRQLAVKHFTVVREGEGSQEGQPGAAG